MRRLATLATSWALLVVAPHLPTSGGAATAWAQPKHNCDFCHNLHGGSFTALRDFEVAEDLCDSCHGVSGTEPDSILRDGTWVNIPNNDGAGFAIHDGAKHAAFSRPPTGCWDCHNHEGEAGGNLSMIQASMPTPVSGPLAVVFTSRGSDAGQPTLNSFADGDEDNDGDYTGVCEVCHTETSNHQNGLNLPDGSSHTHEVGRTCSDCHGHDKGFAGGGPCASCHSSAQNNGDGLPAGGRRPVLPEFARSSHHVDWTQFAAGSQTPDSIPDSDCQVCHDQSQHQQGTVRLWAVDAPGDTAATVKLTGDPDTNSALADSLERFCLGCHDADGADGDTSPFSDAVLRPEVNVTEWHVSGHGTGTDTLTCWDCHGRGHGSSNLKMVSDTVVTPNSGSRPVVFTVRTGSNSFADGDATYNGVCEVCHTTTDFHRNDGNEPFQHKAQADCIACHNHDQGLPGAGTCWDCHNTAVGSRRAVAADFSRASHHVTTFTDSVPAATCQICHDQSQHRQGVVRLKNVNDSSIVELLTNPALAGEDTTAAKLTDFCLACHDVNGAGGDTDPFGDGVAPPVIDATAWSNASHGSAAAIAGCYGDGTFGCHASGHGSDKNKMLAPFDVAPVTSADEEEGVCLTCHDADGPAATDLATAFNQPVNWVQTPTGLNANPDLNDRHDIQETAQTRSGAKIECTNCHNPHTATSAQPFILDPDTTSADNHVVGTNWYFSAYQAAGDVLSEFCLDCHDGTYPPGVLDHIDVPITNIRTTWVDDGMGERTGSSVDMRPGTGWGIGDVLPCSACHTPHIVIDNSPGVNTTALFHVVDQVYSKDGSTELFFYDRKGDPVTDYGITNNLDKNDVTSGGYWCNTCHDRISMTGKENCYGCHRHGDGGRW